MKITDHYEKIKPFYSFVYWMSHFQNPKSIVTSTLLLEIISNFAQILLKQVADNNLDYLDRCTVGARSGGPGFDSQKYLKEWTS